MVLHERSVHYSPGPLDLTPGNFAVVVAGIKRFLTGCKERGNGLKRVGRYDKAVPYDLRIRELEVELAIAGLLEDVLTQAVKRSVQEEQERLTEREVHIRVQAVSPRDAIYVLELMFIAKWEGMARQEPQRYIRISSNLSRPVTEVLAGGLRLKTRLEKVGTA